MIMKHLALALGAVAILGCGSRFGAVYPPRPPTTPAGPLADPTPTRIVAHITVTQPALRDALDEAVPKNAEGSFRLAGDRKYRWERDKFAISFAQGRVAIDTHVTATIELPLTSMTVPFDLHIVAEPVVSAEYAVKMQATEVKVTTSDRRLRLADAASGILDSVGHQIEDKVKEFRHDLKPLLAETYEKIKKPFEFPLGDAKGCAELRVLGIEAGPTILADGIEKDLALVVAPQVTLPCNKGEDVQTEHGVPPLSNVATLIPGPFTVQIPIAARYDELAKAMSLTFTNGKYHFSQEYPELYLSEPEVYASQDRLVLKLRIRGPVHKFGIDTDLDGDLFLSGHPTLVDNELSLPDLEPTIETSNFLLKLKAMTDGDKIRDQARAAMRLDLADRFRSVRDQIKSSLEIGDPKGCFRGAVDKIEVTGVYPHGPYVRVTVAVTGRARMTMPCLADAK
jgi:hypothetical protein